MSAQLPQHTQVLIVGGGIIGCSVAYHLTKLGWRDVLLLERRQLTCGTTWHAAGLVGQLRATRTMTKLAQYTAELYRSLEGDVGQETGYKQNGSIGIANNQERWEELRRAFSTANAFELEAELLAPDDIKRLWPLMNTSDLLGGLYLPTDGQTNAIDTCQALARGARKGGATLIEGVTVTAINSEAGKVTGVSTVNGDVSAEVVVNCAGMWGREIGQMAGVSVPLQACEHFYVITEEIDGVPSDLPVLRDMDGHAYVKEDAGKLLIGSAEPNPRAWGVDGIPPDFCFDELPEDIDHFMPILEQAMERVPILENVGIRKFFNGPESFTPDARPLLGEAPNLRKFYVAAGLNTQGIQSAGGVGRALAEWIVADGPTMDLTDLDIKRMAPFQSLQPYVHERAVESLGMLYSIHWPYKQRETMRGLRRSPVHSCLAENGACFGEAAGWERANWFAEPDNKPQYEYSFKRQNWFGNWRQEHLAIREQVGLYDVSSFSKILVQGKDSEVFLQRICANDIAVEPGRIVYTPWLNANAGIEADLTVTRLADEQFMIISGAGTLTRDLAWLQRHSEDDQHVAITDITPMYATFGIMGPKSREFLQVLTTANLLTDAFPFGASREIDLCGALVRASRITYVGELGWEVYVPSDFAAHVFEALLLHGEDFGLRQVGMHAIDSLRTEKGYRHWGHDIGNMDNPVEAGLGFACALNKKVNFIGRDAFLRCKEMGAKRRLVQLKLRDPEPLLYHNEPIVRDGKISGYSTSGSYGHSIGSAVALGYLEHDEVIDGDFVRAGSYEIEIAGERYPAEASLRPFYDPDGRNIHT